MTTDVSLGDLEQEIYGFSFLVCVLVDHWLKLFHRFVRPSRMSERRINEYIEGKYGKFGVDRYASNVFMVKA